MALSSDLLAPGEKVIFHARAHWKNLVGPILVLALCVAAVVVLLGWVVTDARSYAWARWTIAAAALVVAAVWTVRPFLQWLCSTDTLTTRRLISRRGVLRRTGRDLPIARVNAVSYERSVLDRILGCGTLVVQTAGMDSDVELYDVAKLELRLLQVQELLIDAEIPAEGNTPDAERDGRETGRNDRTEADAETETEQP